MNERKTENIVRKHFEKFDIKLEEQKSDNPRIQKLLKNASKSGNGIGKPEFIFEPAPGISRAYRSVVVSKERTIQ